MDEYFQQQQQQRLVAMQEAEAERERAREAKSLALREKATKQKVIIALLLFAFFATVVGVLLWAQGRNRARAMELETVNARKDAEATAREYATIKEVLLVLLPSLDPNVLMTTSGGETAKHTLRRLRDLLDRATDLPESDLAMLRSVTAAVAFGVGDGPLARDLFKQVLEFDARTAPNSHEHADSLSNYGRALLLCDEIDAARPVLDEAIRVSDALGIPGRPQQGRARYALAEYHLQADDPKEALRFAQLAAGALSENDPHVLGLIAKAFSELRAPNAIEAFDRAIAAQKSDFDRLKLRFSKLVHRVAIGDFDGEGIESESSAIVDEFIRLYKETDGQTARVLSHHSQVLRRNGKYAEAVKVAEKARRVAGDAVPPDLVALRTARRTHAVALIGLGDQVSTSDEVEGRGLYDKASDELHSLILEMGEDPPPSEAIAEYHEFFGIAKLRTKGFVAAEEQFKKALHIRTGRRAEGWRGPRVLGAPQTVRTGVRLVALAAFSSSSDRAVEVLDMLAQVIDEALKDPMQTDREKFIALYKDALVASGRGSEVENWEQSARRSMEEHSSSVR